MVRTPKSQAGNYTARFFQSLTPDIGHPALTAQIYRVIGIINISSNWAEFKRDFNKMVDRSNGQQELNFEEIKEDVEKIEKSTTPKPIQGVLFEEDESSFNKPLKQALDFNPNKGKKKKDENNDDSELELVN